jgi:hypothetical protein
VSIAAITWIVFGCLILISGAINLVMQMTVLAAPGKVANPGVAAASGTCGVVIIVLFGAAFLFVGVQSIRGTASDTLGNGIGSIIFGVLNLSCGGSALVGLSGGMVRGGPAAIVVGIGAAINVLGGLALLTAGVLALIGRSQYLAWKRGAARLDS